MARADEPHLPESIKITVSHPASTMTSGAIEGVEVIKKSDDAQSAELGDRKVSPTSPDDDNPQSDSANDKSTKIDEQNEEERTVESTLETPPPEKNGESVELKEDISKNGHGSEEL